MQTQTQKGLFHSDFAMISPGGGLPIHSNQSFKTAFPVDGVGDDKPEALPAVIITTDDIADDISTTDSITVDGPHVFSTIDTIGDQDFFSVELTEGEIYEIGMFAHIGGANGVPLADAYLEIYDDSGNLIVIADGGGPNTPSGLDALLSFTADYTGTFYINARAYDELMENGETGDFVGDYELFVDTGDEFSYRPYYSPDQPLHAIDWGSQIDGSSRNPDGDQGPRDNGEPFTGYAWNPYGIEGKTVVTYYLAREGDVFVSEDPTNPGLTENIVASGWDEWEQEALEVAFDQFESVADIVYIEVDNRNEADFTLITYSGTPGPGVSLLGRMSPPDEQNEGQAEFNAGDERWNEEGLARGGFTFVTLIHELGHGHGLAHPHDSGGRSGVLSGVETEGAVADYTLGDFNLNQGVFTMMSYEDGWQTSPYGQADTSDPYGWLGGLMAFDIAAIQDKYGVNEDTNTGDDVYVLKDVNEAGTFYESIWDAGGEDQIVYNGDRDANIDLRDATLEYEEGGGGWVSYAFGVHGGFTIANAVTIENARGGNGNDTLIGNEVANRLQGGIGADSLFGGAGTDNLKGGAGRDVIYGDSGNDRLFGNGGADSLFGGTGNDRILGEGGMDFISGGDGNDVIRGGIGNDTLYGDGGDDLVLGGNQDDSLFGGDGDDRLLGSDGNDLLEGGVGDDLLRGGTGLDILVGGEGDDSLKGEAGDDTITGGAGQDFLYGQSGSDTFVFLATSDSSTESDRDRIINFESGTDMVDLTAIDADTTTGGDQGFSVVGAFSGVAGELVIAINGANATISGDVDGDGIADFVIAVTGDQPVETDFLL